MFQRIAAFDSVRGLAIFTMIYANMGPFLSGHPFWFRLYGSFAAPLFVILAGMMVSYSIRLRDHRFSYFLIRGLFIVLMGAIIDVLAYGIIPFTTFDILYLIGLSLPIAYLVNKLNWKTSLLLCLGIFLVTPLLQSLFGYTEYPSEFYLSGALTVETETQTGILQSWFLDGWFPVFPWVGFLFFGVYVIRSFEDQELSPLTFTQNKYLITSLLLMAIGISLWTLVPGVQHNREGYSELFYPATLGFVVTSLGVTFLSLYLFSKTATWRVWCVFKTLGQASFFMYILHIFLLYKVAAQFWSDLSISQSLILYLGVTFVCYLFAWVIQAWKDKRKKPFPMILKFVLGS